MEDEDLGREEAYDQWYSIMERRFLDGKDDDFDYALVDYNEDYDDRSV